MELPGANLSHSSNVAARAREDHNIAVQVSYPALAMLRVVINVRLLKDLRLKVKSPLDGLIKLIGLEPEEDTITVRF